MNLFIEPAEMDVFRQAGEPVVLAASQFVYFEGEPASHLYLIETGRVRVFILSPAGDEMTLEIVEQGRVFGESSFYSHAARPTNVQAVTAVRLIKCRVDSLLDHLRLYPDLLIKLLQQCNNTINHLTGLLRDINFLDQYGKVASFLLEQTAQENPAKAIKYNELPYSHEEIAWCVGLGRSTVTRILSAFEERGWIQRGYKCVRLTDRPAMAAYLRLQFTREL